VGGVAATVGQSDGQTVEEQAQAARMPRPTLYAWPCYWQDLSSHLSVG